MRPSSAAARGGLGTAMIGAKSAETNRPGSATSLAAPVTSANASEHRRNLEEHIRRLDNERRQHQDATTEQLKQNKELIKELRRENQELKSMIAAAKRGQGSVQQVEGLRLENQVAEATRRFDALRDEERDAREQLRLEEEKLVRIEVDSQPLLLPNSALSRRIRALESRLDKSLIKYNEAVSIKRTYELIARRLKDERVGFDNQLAAIERTLKSKEYDYQELLKMSHAANHAKEKAKRDLQQFKLKFDADRRSKDRELGERKAFVQSRVEQTQRLERKERNLKQQEADDERMRQEESQRAQNTSSMQGGGGQGGGAGISGLLGGDGELLGGDEASQRTKLLQYESAFRRIQAATGVRDLQEMLQRFVTSEETHRQLEQLASDSNARIDQMRVENNELGRRVEELRYSGSGAVGSRRLTQEFTLHLAEAGNQTKAAQGQFERLAKLLVHVKAGVEHLMDKLVVYRPDLVTPPMSDDTVMEVLKVAEQKLYALVDEMGPVGAQHGAGTQQGLSQAPPELPPYNRRIRPPRDDEEADEADDGGRDEDPGQDDEAVLRREQVKKISANAILRESKKQRRKKAQMQG